MSFKKSMMGLGMPPQLAAAVAGGVSLAQTATGSTGPTAFPLVHSFTEFTTTAGSTGAILPDTSGPALAGDTMWVLNMGANTLAVYPPAGKTINAGSADAAVSITTLKTGCFICKGDGNWYALLSA